MKVYRVAEINPAYNMIPGYLQQPEIQMPRLFKQPMFKGPGWIYVTNEIYNKKLAEAEATVHSIITGLKTRVDEIII